MQVNIIVTNRDFLKVIFKEKTVILDSSYINETLVQGNYYRRTHHVTRSTCKTSLVTHSTRLTTRSTRLSIRSTRLSTCSARFSTRNTRLSIRLYVCPFVVLVCPLAVLVCPLVVSACPLLVPVALSVGLFITDLTDLNIFLEITLELFNPQQNHRVSAILLDVISIINTLTLFIYFCLMRISCKVNVTSERLSIEMKHSVYVYKRRNLYFLSSYVSVTLKSLTTK